MSKSKTINLVGQAVLISLLYRFSYRIKEHDGAEDMLGLLQQIGGVPVTFDR